MKKIGRRWMVQQTPFFLADLGDEFMSLQLGTHIFYSYNCLPMQLTSQIVVLLETLLHLPRTDWSVSVNWIFHGLNCTSLNSNWAPEHSKSGHWSRAATDLCQYYTFRWDSRKPLVSISPLVDIYAVTVHSGRAEASLWNLHGSWKRQQRVHSGTQPFHPPLGRRMIYEYQGRKLSCNGSSFMPMRNP